MAMLFYGNVNLHFGPTVNLLLLHCGSNVIPLFGSCGPLYSQCNPTLWFLCPVVPGISLWSPVTHPLRSALAHSGPTLWYLFGAYCPTLVDWYPAAVHTMWSTQCGPHNVVHTMWSTQCGPHNVVHTMWSTLCGPHNVVHTMWSTQCGPHYVVHTMWSTQCGPHYVVHTMWSTQCGPHWSTAVPLLLHFNCGLLLEYFDPF